MNADDAALVAAATSTSGLIWVTVGDGPPEPMWHHWHDGVAYVIVGGPEQPARGLDMVDAAAVTAHSKSTGQRLLTWRARVGTVPPGSDEWERVVPEVHAARLNAAGGREAPQRWAADSLLVRLEPTGELTEPPERLPENSGAAPPRRTSATTQGKPPFVIGRRRRG